MKKKLTAVALVVCMLAVMLVGASLAYFTDKEEVHNTFTVGNVSIDLYEMTYNEVDGMDLDSSKTHHFEKELKYSDIMPGDTLSKMPYVKNDGDNTAYVRVSVVMNNLDAINNAIDEAYEAQDYSEEQIQQKYRDIFVCWGVQYSHAKDEEGNEGPRMWMKENFEGMPGLLAVDMAARIANDSSKQTGYYVYDINNWFVTGTDGFERGDTNHDGYDAQTGYYERAVEPDQRIYVYYLRLKPNEEVKLFDGLNVPTDFNADQLDMFDGLKIDIYADAIQAANFVDDEAEGGATAMEKAFAALEEVHPVGWWNNAE